MSLPILHLSGTPYEQGLQHGRELKDRIRHNIEVYFDRFKREGKLEREEVMIRAKKYSKAIASQNPDYFTAMRGIADGSGFELEVIAALNVRFEILYYQTTVNAMLEGCTSFAISPNESANGHLLLGQNWDWIPRVQGAVLHTSESDGLESLSFTEAGIVGGKIGLNSAGIGLAVNGLNTTDDDWSRLSKPFHVRCYEILRSRDFDTAVRVVTDTERACSTNFLIAEIPDRIVDVEAAPYKMRLLGCENGCLVHTNHFLDPNAIGIVEPPIEKRKHSYHRLARLRALLDAKRPISTEDLQGYLRDHEGYPNSICRHPDLKDPVEERTTSVTSVVMDLHAGRLYLTDGRPCENAYQSVSID